MHINKRLCFKFVLFAEKRIKKKIIMNYLRDFLFSCTYTYDRIFIIYILFIFILRFLFLLLENCMCFFAMQLVKVIIFKENI
jgi:hypothetical protein